MHYIPLFTSHYIYEGTSLNFICHSNWHLNIKDIWGGNMHDEMCMEVYEW